MGFRHMEEIKEFKKQISLIEKYIDEDKLIKLNAKSQMEQMLVEQTTVGDLILFANDAPSFI